MALLRKAVRGERSCKIVVRVGKLIKKPRIDPKKIKEKKVLEDLMNKTLLSLSLKDRHKLASLIRSACIIKLQTKSRQGKSSRGSSSDGSVTSSSQIVPIVKKTKLRIVTRAVINQVVKKEVERKKDKLGEIQKIEDIRKNIKTVKWNEMENNVNYELMVRKAINTDPCLAGYYSRKIDNMIDRGVMKRLANSFYAHLRRENVVGKGEEVELQFEDKLMKTINKGMYSPPSKRLLILGGESKNWKTSSLIFSDLSKETTKNICIPDAFSYKYTNRNAINLAKYPELAKFTKEAEKPENIIKCVCCEGGLMKKCWENKDCPCYQANKKLRDLQAKNDRDRFQETILNTFDPILVRTKDHFFDTIGFSCSESCACQGRCTNNATFLLEKNIAQLEVYRKNELMGFGLRSNTLIPAGTPILEFTGELYGEELKDEDNDYSYAFINQESFQKRAFEISKAWDHKNWSKKFKEDMVELLSKTWYLNPKRIGNIARTCCHSCEPNLAMVRVFQKGFSPAHCRLILVTQEVIFPGVELTFDYGPGYVKETLKTVCLCKRAACVSSIAHKTLKTASLQSLEEYHSLRYHYQYKEYQKILDEVEKKELEDALSGSS